MRFFWSVPLCGLLASMWPATANAEAAAAEGSTPAAQYIGAEACGKCHKRDSTGNQLGKWQESKHSKAFATLASPAALKIAKEKGIADPQKDAKCLKCHVTAPGADPSLIATPAKDKKGFQMADGVQCESCHGPGSLYKSRKVMKVRADAVAAGMLIPDEKTCTGCHNEESPTFKPFAFEEMVAKIAHPNPKLKKE